MRLSRALTFLTLLFASHTSVAAFTTKYYTGSLTDCATETSESNWGSDFCSLASYVQRNVRPLENAIEAFGQEQVVLLGDTHPNKLLKTWLARNLKDFKAAGFTHIGLEALNSESQELVDRFQNDVSLRPQVLSTLTKDWGWIPDEHLALIEAIQKSGLKLVALDNRNELEKKGLEDKIQLRNEHMAAIIEDHVNAFPRARMLVLTGKVHSALNSEDSGEFTLTEVLNSKRIETLSMDLESGEQLVPPQSTQAFILSLLLNLLPSSNSGDYILKLPQEASANSIVFITK